MKKIPVLFFTVLFIIMSFTGVYNPVHIPYKPTQIDSMISFAKTNNCNSHIGIFINFSLRSGSNRFFLVDLDNRKTILSGLCSHGQGKSGFTENVTFSNEINSRCSSEGFYKTGRKYKSGFGKAYKLYGLSATNSNAYDRTIVLHPCKCVPETVPDSVSICKSSGCPQVSPGFFEKLSPYIDKSKQPVLLWVYKD